jgi:hypothetical protein
MLKQIRSIVAERLFMGFTLGKSRKGKVERVWRRKAKGESRKGRV